MTGPTPTPVDAAAELSVTLQAHEWNAVLDTLADGKYRVVGPLIQRIGGQLQESVQQAEQPPGPRNLTSVA